MTKIERKVHSIGLWIYGKASGKYAFIWPTKYGRPIGEAIMSAMVKRAKARKLANVNDGQELNV